jgi:hypothetical protein
VLGPSCCSRKNSPGPAGARLWADQEEARIASALTLKNSVQDLPVLHEGGDGLAVLPIQRIDV